MNDVATSCSRCNTATARSLGHTSQTAGAAVVRLAPQLGTTTTPTRVREGGRGAGTHVRIARNALMNLATRVKLMARAAVRVAASSALACGVRV